MRTGLHFAKLEKSPRLQGVLQVLKEMGNHGATTRDIMDTADVCAVNSCISELRAQGYPITCTFEGRTSRGSSVFRYKLGEK